MKTFRKFLADESSINLRDTKLYNGARFLAETIKEESFDKEKEQRLNLLIYSVSAYISLLQVHL